MSTHSHACHTRNTSQGSANKVGYPSLQLCPLQFKDKRGQNKSIFALEIATKSCHTTQTERQELLDVLN